jgi:hypothetical protein
MTIERKIVVGLEDLKALIFECRAVEKACKSRVSVSPDQARIPARALAAVLSGCGTHYLS